MHCVGKYCSKNLFQKVSFILIASGIVLFYIYSHYSSRDLTVLYYKDPVPTRVCVWNVTVNNVSFTIRDLDKETIGSVIKKHSGPMLDEQVRTFSIKAILCDSLKKSPSPSPSSSSSLKAETKLTKIKQKPKAKVTTQRRCRDRFLSEFEREKRFLCFQINGRLGNQMFGFASAYGIARHLNRSLVVDQTLRYLKSFKINVTVADPCVCQDTKIVTPKSQCSFDEKLFNIPNNGNYKLKGYVQSWVYFSDVQEEVKKQFKFNDDITNKALVIINKIKKNLKKMAAKSKNSNFSITLVGIHNRLAGIRNHFKVAPKEYIINAINYFRTNFTNVVFIVCSDNIGETKATLKGQAGVFFVEGNSSEVDMCVLTLCNHTIMTVGTFGWWSAFLTGGITLYYKHPHKIGTNLRRQFSANYTDYFYPNWIAME